MATALGDVTAARRPTLGEWLEKPPVRFGQLVAVGVLCFTIFVGVLYPTPVPVLALGAVIGSLTALLAVGLVLIYRANHIINFAQGNLGASAGLVGILLITAKGWPYLPAVIVGFALSLLLGAFIEVALIRRFANSPRLILSVATIGIALILQGAELVIPRAFGLSKIVQDFPTPLSVSFSWGPVVFRGAHVLAVAVVIGWVIVLGAFLRYSRIGIAVRASAESAERAAQLGIPVKRVLTLVWIIAAALSATGYMLRAPIVGVPLGTALGPALLLRALAAAVIGRMENLPVTFAAAVILGMLESAVFFETQRTIVTDFVLFAIIIAALLLQRRGAVSRAEDAGAASWQSVAEVRPIPPELRDLPEVKWGGRGLGVVVLALVVLVPLTLRPSRVNLFALGPILAMVGLSLVVLTGWSGQISLGQIGFFALGAAASAKLASVGWDFGASILLAGLLTAGIATVIGIPSLRIRGPFLAVATLGFAQATSTFFLNPEFFPWFVIDERTRVIRPILFGKLDLESEHTYYFVVLFVLALVVFSVSTVRRSRLGRVLIATRDNLRGAQSYGISGVRARLVGFAFSGFLAGLAGGLFAFHQHGLSRSAFIPEESIRAFSYAVVGGLGSVPGVIIGGAFFTGLDYFFLPGASRFFISGALILVILLFLPGGLGQLIYRVRDSLLRVIARRRNLVVPSLLADVRVEEPLPVGPGRPVEEAAG